MEGLGLGQGRRRPGLGSPNAAPHTPGTGGPE
jgi:hypothetical protein